MESPESLCRAGNPLIPPEKCHADSKSVDVFVVDDLLDFSNEEEATDDDEPYAANSTDSSTVTVVDSCCNSSFSGSDQNFSGDRSTDAHFSGELCVPCEDVAELEWLSNFVEEESFSSEDMQKLQLISGMKARTDGDASEFTGGDSRNNPILRPDVSVPGKARSKRSRAAPSTWSSRMLVSSESESGKKSAPRKRDASEEEDGRKCLHCSTEKTPQWRTGPMGPKTLCNACGVRYQSGRLVPEYRPAASPTFVLSKHSNSHRKVMELRRQKFLRASECDLGSMIT